MAHLAHVVVDSAAGYSTAVRAGRHHLTADEPASRGGGDGGPTPHELLLAGLAACTAITLRMYADRKQWALGAIHVDVELVKEDDGSERIRRVVSFGERLDDAQRGRLAEIAEKTPVTKVVKGGLPIATELRAG